MYRKPFLVLSLLALSISIFSQAEPKKTPDPDQIRKLQADAVDLLKETSADVNNLRSLPNRIGFSAELASLMWYQDERQAKAMYVTVITDYRELLARYNADMSAASMVVQPGAVSDEISDKMVAERRMRTAITVGQQITSSIAEHDPELAFNFYFDSLSAISNPEFRKQIESQSGYFEIQLVTRIAQKDPSKAAQFALRSIRSGFNFQHIELLRSLYAKDADAGVLLGEGILSSIKAGRPGLNNVWAIGSLISFGTETLQDYRKPGGKRPVFSESQLRELSESSADAILNLSKEEAYAAGEYANRIEVYSPGRAAQIRTKFGIKKPPSVRRDIPTVMGTEAALEEVTKLQTKVENNPQMQEAKRFDDREKQMYADVASKLTKELPATERERIIAESRKIIAETPGRQRKIAALCFIAARVKQAGDQELATGILKDAASFVNPEPKNYQDFLLTWALATGYASAEPDMAFALLGDTISRANETINAFIKVGEFMDTTGEIIDDGEVQVGAFGGNMVRGITGELGLADLTIQMLARADFARTRDLTNKFDRPEVRVLAKMLVVRAVLGSKFPLTPEPENKASLNK